MNRYRQNGREYYGAYKLYREIDRNTHFNPVRYPETALYACREEYG